MKRTGFAFLALMIMTAVALVCASPAKSEPIVMKFWGHHGVYKSKRAKKTIRKISRDGIKSIAVIRHAALGDMVLTRSFLVEARKAFPNASITLCLVSHYIDILNLRNQ